MVACCSQEEMDALTDQAAMLEATLDRLKHSAGLPSTHSVAQQRIDGIMLREMVRNNQYLLANMRSRLAKVRRDRSKSKSQEGGRASMTPWRLWRLRERRL